jgi:signal peptidase II
VIAARRWCNRAPVDLIPHPAMPHSTRATYPLLLAAVTLPLYILDQATKIAVLRTFRLEEARTVIPGFFELGRWHNTGAAFSIMSDSNNFFIGLSIVAIGVISYMAKRGMFPDTVSRFGFALLLSGILGNLTDRIAHGYVVDFLLFDFHVRFANPWPAFNVADSCICIAAALFIIQSFREPKEEQDCGLRNADCGKK